MMAFTIKVYKPNKTRFFVSNLAASLFITLFMFLPMVISVSVSHFFIVWQVVLIAFAAFVLIGLLVFTLLWVSYKNRYYAYTSKRILVRSGIVGVDFKGLDHKMIGATEVKVGVVDKLFKLNTGTIRFGSQASPMTNQQGSTSMFIFDGITDPYEVYREIKKYIDTTK